MSIETISTHPAHFEEHHENNETLVCMQANNQCAVLVELAGTPEQQEILSRAVQKGLEKLDEIFEGRFGEVFSGLHVKFGNYEGGGEAHQDQNMITFDVNRMSMSLAQAEGYLIRQGELNPGDWTSVMSEVEAAEPGSCATYNLVHEVGHLLDERAEDGSWQGIDVDDSPTKYGMKKRNEAFAESFAHYGFGRSVVREDFVRQKVQERLAA